MCLFFVVWVDVTISGGPKVLGVAYDRAVKAAHIPHLSHLSCTAILSQAEALPPSMATTTHTEASIDATSSLSPEEVNNA
jgi:hypothetical protein